MFEPNQLINDRYRVVNVLGKGGFGVVYHVIDTTDNQSYALKTFLQNTANRRAIDRFRQEAEIWIMLGAHPYLVQAFFVEEIDGRIFVGMELIQSGKSGYNDLDGIIKNTRPEMSQILTWGIQICFGMEYAASRGIRSHRDLKPPNILINHNNDVKISDFGLATHRGSSELRPLLSEVDLASNVFKGQTKRGIGFGTPTHMPPEQFDDAAFCDVRSDVYAVGVILYQLALGALPVSLPWPTDALLESRLAFWRDMHEAHSQFQMPSTDSVLQHVLEKAITPDPADRYPSFTAMRADLETLLFERTNHRVPVPKVEEMDASSWEKRGKSLLSLMQFDEGLLAFNNAIDMSNQSEWAWIGKAECLIGLNQQHEAISCLQYALQLSAGNAVALTLMGKCLRAQGRINEARRLFDDALRHDPNQHEAFLEKGNQLLKTNDPELALWYFEQGLNLKSKSVSLLVGKGNALSRTGQYKDAIVSYDAALVQWEGCPPALIGKAICYARQGEYRSAERIFSTFESELGLDDSTRVLYGLCLFRLHLHDDALVVLDKVTEVDSSKSATRLRIRILIAQYQYAAALDWMEWLQSVQDKKNESDIVALAVLNHICGKMDKSLDGIRELYATNPENLALNCLTCCRYLTQGMDEEALVACDYAESFHPFEATNMYNRAIVLSALGRNAEAEEAFERVVQIRPDWSHAWFNYSVVLAKNRRGGQSMIANKQWLRLNLDQASQVDQLPDRKLGAYVSFHDTIQASSPSNRLTLSNNAWHPRFRLPHLHPPVLLFPLDLPN